MFTAPFAGVIHNSHLQAHSEGSEDERVRDSNVTTWDDEQSYRRESVVDDVLLFPVSVQLTLPESDIIQENTSLEMDADEESQFRISFSETDNVPKSSSS